MLTETFIHVPEVGFERERALWEGGFRTWWDVLNATDDQLPPGTPTAFLRQTLSSSLEALERSDWEDVARLLKPANHWRALRMLEAPVPQPLTLPPLRVLALDIETEGISKWENHVTAVGVCGDATGFAPLALLPHRPQFQDQLFGVLEQTDLLLTFNGSQFDIPFLKAQPGLHRMPIPPFHVDLRFLFAASGIRGGLKRVQVDMGYKREGALAEVDGYMAVLLWQEHLRRTPGALDTLVRYCLEDVVVLLDLAPIGYNLMAKSLGRTWQAPSGPNVSLAHLPYDPVLINRLSNRTNFRRYRPMRNAPSDRWQS